MLFELSNTVLTIYPFSRSADFLIKLKYNGGIESRVEAYHFSKRLMNAFAYLIAHTHSIFYLHSKLAFHYHYKTGLGCRKTVNLLVNFLLILKEYTSLRTKILLGSFKLDIIRLYELTFFIFNVPCFSR
jgi:hypothetical protein